jgi:dolichyl-phosphate beta-glucosyltransferase
LAIFIEESIETASASYDRITALTENFSLSIVIPAYNEENRLNESLAKITAFVTQQSFPIEVVIVNNNSSDNTQQIIDKATQAYPYIHGMIETAQGKGAAVRTGMLAAQNDYLFICDADLSMPIEEVLKFLPPRLSGYDIAIGSREATGAQRIDEPASRHIIGRMFNLIIRIFIVRGFQDTQCGFKCFRREVAQDLFPYQTINGWIFDVELLHIAQKRGYKIVEVPVTWYYKSNSKVKPVRDLYQVVRDVLKTRLNSLQGVYARRRNA